MSNAPVAEIDIRQLGTLGDELGRGGQAVVFDLPGLHLPGEPQHLVYKRYKTGMGPSRLSLSRLVDLRHGLAEGPRDRLDAVAAWPLAAVVDGVALTGVVLPRIPDAYFQDVVLPSGTAETVVREVQYLFVPPDRNKRIGMPMPDDDQRLRICRDLADLLAFLHDDLAVAFGDLNAKNELFRLDAEPMIMLVDCDAARTRGDTSAQPNTPDWIPLDPHEPLSRLSDRYKLGLFILRCLTPGPQGSTRTDPSAAQILDAEGIDLLRAAIEGPPRQRPDALEWYRYLSRCLGEAVDPPVFEAVVPDRTLVAAGEPLTVHWTAQNADEVELVAEGADPVVVDGRPGSGSAEVYPARTGRVRGTARNRLGTVAAASPPVMVVDMPAWADLPVPVPRLPMPDLSAVGLPEVTAVLPPLPAVGAVGLPSLAEPVGVWTSPDVQQPAPLVEVAGPPPAFDTGETGFPLDTLSILTGAPDLDGGPISWERAAS